MTKIRVLTVDDSVVIRRILADILSQDSDIEVVGYASNGRLALAKIPQLNPDLITLDIEMPEMDGLETLTELRKTYPKLPVIMFSTLTERGAEATLEALSRGATDYVAKPANVGSVSAGIQSVKAQLIPRIKALCPHFKPASSPSIHRLAPIGTNLQSGESKPHRSDIVVIGSSTGGPQALTVVLKSLPADFPVPVAVVQHMPPIFTRNLANRLNQECELEVREAVGGEILEPGKVFIAPGDFHMELQRVGPFAKTVLHQAPPENSCRPSVDVLFRSAAQVYGMGTLGVVLTGMGQDGLRGAEHIVQKGGTMVVQDEATCVVWGMPRAIADAQLAHSIQPLTLIANELHRLTSLGRRQFATC
jgi:two-component system, chemotaxis family, protein-glutamate methylesterase/glutaminase